MNSLLHAYEAYERRIIRGELDALPKKSRDVPREPLIARFGDWMIRSGMRLKRRYAVSGKAMAWSPLTGSKP